MSIRHYTLMDRLLIQADTALCAILGSSCSKRDNPATGLDEPKLSQNECRHSAGLMRVNHSGEVCAQALYNGQLLVARNPQTETMLRQAADEETDHLAWTAKRLEELGSRTSHLNIFWYHNAFLLGVIAGLAGDRYSLGFVEETERQVSCHLAGHLGKLPPSDTKSRVIVEQMKNDEEQHGTNAHNAGAMELPQIVKQLMRLHAKVMTTLAYWL